MTPRKTGPLTHTILIWTALCVALVLQVGVNSQLRPLRPAIDEMPYPPSALASKALAFGDDQFLFRTLTSWLQEFGDGGGRLRPLREYDYHRVIGWLKTADSLDPASDAIFALGSTYFGAITDPVAAPPRLKLLTEYFRDAGLADPERRWPWLVWAAVKIQHNVGDPVLARQTAEKMLGLEGDDRTPYWLPLMAAPLYRAAGDKDAALALDGRADLMALRRRAFRELNIRLYGIDGP